MTTIVTETMGVGYHLVGQTILEVGEEVAPRGIATVEAAPMTVVLTNPLESLPVGTGRGVVTALAVVEALSLIAGQADPRLFVAASPRYADFVDPSTGELEVAYGPRLERQMFEVEDRLRADESSRQAHVNLWHADVDRPGERAYPCVTSCGFTVRNGRLNCFVEMRSNDFWLGLPYDMFMFAQLQVTLANVLRKGIGTYSHYARSLHVYAKDVDKVGTLEPNGNAATSPFWGVDGGSWGEAQERAAMLLDGDLPSGATDSEGHMHRVMSEKVLPRL